MALPFMRLLVCFNETGLYGEARSKQFAPRIENKAKPLLYRITQLKGFFFNVFFLLFLLEGTGTFYTSKIPFAPLVFIKTVH